MKQNILIVGYDFRVSKSVAEKLAEFFSMRVLDELELLEFDYVPRGIDELILLRGVDFVKQELIGLLKGGIEFENVIYIADFSLAAAPKETLFKVNQNYVLVFLYKDSAAEALELSRKQPSSGLEKLFYYSEPEIVQNHEFFSEVADIKIDITGLSAMDIFFKTVGGIKNFYNMN